MDAHIKKAFVMGAGLGTRLRPLTAVRPKPLLPIFGKPLITFALDHLRSAGVESFVVNTHHLALQFDEVFGAGEYAGCPVKLVFEPDVLETGGGIKNAERWIGNGPFIVYSGDILTDIDLEALVEEHFSRKNDVTLALRKTGLSTSIALKDRAVVDIKGKYGHVGEYDFANVSVWNAEIFQRIPAGRKIAFVPVLADWIGQGGRIGGIALEGRQWFNIGSHAEYLAVHRYIGEKHWKPAYADAPGWPVAVSPSASIAPSARLGGICSVGEGCVIGADAVIEDTILWPGAKIAPGTHLRSCVVAGSMFISGRHDDVDLTDTPMSLENLILQTQEKFPGHPHDRVEISPLEKGGSDRKFYRISMGDENPVILVKYSDQKEENRHYVTIAQFLAATGVNVPRIYFHDETEGLIWMEDLGEVDLWEHRKEPWQQLSPLYRNALDQALLLHTRAHLSPLRPGPHLQKEFNAELYLWEQNYFFENCLGRHFKADPAVIESLRSSPPLQDIATELADLPRVLLHRDFQSQNIMIKHDEAFLIDFQGLRPGLAQYDLASLIYDPYVALTEPQREELFHYYLGKSIDAGVAVDAGFRRIFDLCAMQRLMQALGAYGYLGLVMSRGSFLQHIPAALNSLKLVVSRIPDLQSLGTLLDSLP